MVKQGCAVCKAAGLFAIIGVLNWGLIGAVHVNAVHALVGRIPKAERIIYLLVGFSGLALLASCFGCCPKCKKS